MGGGNCLGFVYYGVRGDKGCGVIRLVGGLGGSCWGFGCCWCCGVGSWVE